MMDTRPINAEDSEIAKFDGLASRWWDPDGEMKPLHDINPLRLRYVESRAGLTDKAVLDVGCGGGILTETMAVAGARVTGIDLAGAALKVARLHLLESGRKVSYRQMSVEALAEEAPGSFDVVTCMEMLEHVPSPASVVRACAALARPDGAVFFSTLNRNPKAYLLAIVGAEHLLRLLPRGTHEYRRFIRPSELDRFARGAGLTLEHMTGLHYNPLLRSYRLGGNVDVNYMVHCRRPA